MDQDPVRLYLLTPVLAEVETFLPRLAEALAAAPVAAVLLRLAAADERTLVKRIKAVADALHRADAALVVADPDPRLDLAALVSRGGADGAHAEAPERWRDLRERFGTDRSVGAAGLRTRHDAMEAGEAGVDYVMFGEPRPDGYVPPLDATLERAAWWAEIFQIPCVVHAPGLDAIPELVATGAEFVAVGAAVWDHPDGAAAALAEAHRVATRPEPVS